MKPSRPPADQAGAPPTPDDEWLQAPPVELEMEAATSAGASGRKFLLMALIVALCMAVVHLTPLKQYITDVSAWKNGIQAAGLWGPILFLLAATLLIAAGLPRLLFCMLGGTLFGFTRGFILGQFASLFGSYLTFVFARWSGREWVRRRIERNSRLRDLLQHPSMFSVFLVRQIPIAGIVPNLIFALTPVRHRVFLVGSFLGYLPSAAWVALIGSGIGKQSLTYSMVHISLAMAGLGGVSTLAWYVRRRLTATAR
jgi:uncharacterized membrane protein YdjX (TVP38/TMEM64 family)